MRILWLCHFLPYPATGYGALQRTHHLLLRTAESHDVGVVALSGHGPTSPSLIDEASRYLAPKLAFIDASPVSPGEFRRRRATALVKALTGERPFHERSCWNAGTFESFSERVRRFRPHVVHFDTVHLAAYAAAVAGYPLVLTHHNIESDVLAQRASVDSWSTRWFFRRESRKVAALEARLASRAASNVVVSASDAAALRRIAPNADTVVVPNGVDTDFFRADPPDRRRAASLVFVGSMAWYPNRMAMDWLATELWPALVADRPERRMTVVGRNPTPTLMRVAAADSRFAVTGFVPDMRPFVADASIYLCPIRIGGGTRLKILDALSMQRPVVSTQVGVSGLDLEDDRHYLRAETTDDFVRAVRRLESDPELAARLARVGREFVVERYAWAAVHRELLACFEAVTEREAPVRVS